jgi:predicted nicotinamide N-methyase
LKTFASPRDFKAFIERETRLVAPPLVPEIELYLADKITPLWEATEAGLDEKGISPPYWAFAWVGGQAMARHVLDHGSSFAGKRVLDLAAGSGLAAIAAAMKGAQATAADIDPLACAAAALNAERNNVAIATTDADLLASDAAPNSTSGDWDIIIAGDVCYEKPMAERMMKVLQAHAAKGCTVWLADPGRNYLPKAGLEEIAAYVVPCTRELEDAEQKTVRIYRVPAL